MPNLATHAGWVAIPILKWNLIDQQSDLNSNRIYPQVHLAYED